MAPRSAAERQKARREKLNAEGKYEEYKKAQSLYHREWEKKKIEPMTKHKKLAKKEWERKRKANYR